MAPCKYTGDHRQIMGRSWAVSRILQNYAQIVPNPYIITSAEVVPRNRGGLLRTWPLLIVILRISSTHFLQRVRVFFKHLKETQHLLGTIKQECFIFKLGKSATWYNSTCTAVPQRVKKAAAPGLRRRFAPAKALRDGRALRALRARPFAYIYYTYIYRYITNTIYNRNI